MTPLRISVLAAAIALACVAPAAFADDSATEAQLRRMIELQAQQIAEQNAQLAAMNQRLSALEGAPAGASATPAPSDPMEVQRAQAAVAVADTRQDDDLAILQAQVAQLAAKGGGGNGNIDWRKGGPEFSSSDGTFTFHPRGRVQVDFSSTQGSAFDARNINGTDLASGRLGAEGMIGALGYKIDADFAGNSVTLKDTYLSYDTRLGGLPAEFYVGNKLKDRSIDGATSGVSTPFMERNAVASVGSMDSGYYGLGLTTKLIGENWHASFAVTGDDIGNESDASDTVAYLTRAHWNPVKGKAGFLHVGGWYWYEHLGGDVASINKTSPIALGWNGEVRVSASAIANPSNDHAWGAELGGVWRSGWAFAETTVRTIDSDTEASRDQKATSVSAGWLLTGEKPGFSARSGLWTSTKVKRALTDGGWGAFEVLARYDDYDFTDTARGGEGEAWTLGLNWYLNNWSRLMLNVVHWTTDNKVGAYQGEDSGNTVGVRAQVVF